MIAALASFLEAHRQDGEWHLRIDDVDLPRVAPQASGAIQAELERLGLHWDGPVVHQSERGEAYRAAAESLRRRGLAFACACTRRDAGPGPYPGRCRRGLPPGLRPRSLRLHVHGAAPILIQDRVQGVIRLDVSATVGDFVVVRADAVPAYHLATVVDDHDLGVTEVVRGADLLESTGAQLCLGRALGFTAPCYAHVPVALDASGTKLSKASRAPPTVRTPAAEVLVRALEFLGQDVHGLPVGGPVEVLLAQALERWSLARVPCAPRLPLPATGPGGAT